MLIARQCYTTTSRHRADTPAKHGRFARLTSDNASYDGRIDLLFARGNEKYQHVLRTDVERLHSPRPAARTPNLENPRVAFKPEADVSLCEKTQLCASFVMMEFTNRRTSASTSFQFESMSLE